MKNLILTAVIIIVSALLVPAGAMEPAEESPVSQPPEPVSQPPDALAADDPQGDIESAGTGAGAETEDAPPEEPAPAYVGARKCKVCHLETFKSWEATKHAWALAALNEDELQKPSCLACHTTGFGTGGYGSKGSVTNLGGVQCEACHGPGSLYARSSVMRNPELCAEMGLVKPDSTTCVTCHNSESPTFKGFAYQAGLSTGTHSR
jgi:hypothetical protein